ncbi:NUMOD4 domain-containing protein [Pseudomonas citronellolis]|nr:NUMOD4 domain-containing protein [Pseudomonas citronellolis]
MAELERPDVVAWLVTGVHPNHSAPHAAVDRNGQSARALADHWAERGCAVEIMPLMTVAQHARAVAKWADLFDRAQDSANAARAKVPELERPEALDFKPCHHHAEKIRQRVEEAASVYEAGGSALGYMEDIAESALIVRNGLDELSAQHDRIVEALRADLSTLIEVRNGLVEEIGELHSELADVREERNAAQAKLDELEKQEPVEEWRPVVGFDGHYSVSSLGRLRSDKTGKYLSLNSLMASGYVKASLHRDGVREQTSVHRVVAKAFLDNPEGLDEVNHLNGDKTDNRVINLAWCSRSENVDHGYYQLGHLVHPVKAIPAEGNGPVLIFSSIEQAVANGFTSRNIYDCLVEGYRVHAGHHWQSMRSDQVAQAGQVPEGYMLITQDQVERHATTAWECPPQSRVVLVSTLKRLHEKNGAAPQQGGGA